MTDNPREQQKRNGYNPITLNDVRPEQPDPFFAGLDTPSSRVAGAVLFLFIFSMSRNSPVAVPMLMVLLLACLLFRMTPRERALSAVPLTFSAVRVASQLADSTGNSPASFDTGASWLPLFLAAYLFFTSNRESNTGRVVFWYSLSLLLSGLIPGEGYIVICTVLYYTLWLVITLALISDLANCSSVARPLAPAAQPARA